MKVKSPSQVAKEADILNQLKTKHQLTEHITKYACIVTICATVILAILYLALPVLPNLAWLAAAIPAVCTTISGIIASRQPSKAYHIDKAKQDLAKSTTLHASTTRRSGKGLGNNYMRWQPTLPTIPEGSSVSFLQ